MHCEHADERHFATEADGLERLLERAQAAHLHDMIDPATGQLGGFRTPVGFGSIIDGGVGTKARSRSSFASLEEVAITRAPAALAICSASNETPPVPISSTLLPRVSGRIPFISAFHAATPAHGSVAASSKLRVSATLITPASGKAT